MSISIQNKALAFNPLAGLQRTLFNSKTLKDDLLAGITVSGQGGTSSTP